MRATREGIENAGPGRPGSVETTTKPIEVAVAPLRSPDPLERETAYRAVYEAELGHILATRPAEPKALQLGTNEKFGRYVRASLGRGKRVLEIGCGFGTTALQVGAGRNEVVAVDVAPVAIEAARRFASGRPNLRFLTMQATHLDFPDEGFDVAYSSDLVEHLHPEDLAVHLREVCRVLRPGGLYIVKTPSELTGPHAGKEPGDSGCLHLREYRYGTLTPLLREAGFRRFSAPMFSMRLACRIPGRSRFPAAVNSLAETIACLAPPYTPLRRRLARFLGLKQVLVVARKPVARSG
jgi:ubiquinone/menaquinone biosynthesis C-methylase UbiE